MADGNSNWTIDDAEELYGVKRWGAGYFSIGNSGNIQIAPNHRLPDVTIDMKDVLDEIRSEGIQLPAVIRFHDILRSQVEILNETFAKTIEEASYTANTVACSRSKSIRCVKWSRKLLKPANPTITASKQALSQS